MPHWLHHLPHLIARKLLGFEQLGVRGHATGEEEAGQEGSRRQDGREEEAGEKAGGQEPETQTWRYPLIMAGYLFALAYVASFITYRVVGALS